MNKNQKNQKKSRQSKFVPKKMSPDQFIAGPFIRAGVYIDFYQDKNWNIGKKTKFWQKIEISAKNRDFDKEKVWQKMAQKFGQTGQTSEI